MILRLLRGIKSIAIDPQNYYRELATSDIRLRARDRFDWLRFKSTVQRELAQRRASAPGVITQPLEALFPGITSLAVQAFPIRPQPYNVSWYELISLSAIVRHLQPKTIFEFGTFDGRTTLHLAANGPSDCRVITMDVAAGAFDFGNDSKFCEPTSVGRWFRDHPLSTGIEMLTTDAGSFDFAPYQGEIDMIFIDADHTEHAVRRDSAAAFEMLRPGGVVVWHDYLMLEGVTRALVRMATSIRVFHIEGTTMAIAFGPLPKVPDR